MSANPKNSDQTFSNLLRSDQTEPAKEAGPSTWDKVAATLAGVGEFAAGFAAEQVGIAGKDFVSRVLLDESYTPPSPDKGQDREHDKDKDFDR